MSAHAPGRLYLAVDNPSPRRREESLGYRMGTLAAFVGAVAFVFFFWWGVTTLLFSLG